MKPSIQRPWRLLQTLGAIIPLLAGWAMLAQAVVPPPASAQSVLATVTAVDGSDRLLVTDETGRAFLVQYIGVRGPVRSSVLQQDASASHAAIALGRRVVLESDGKDEAGGLKLRHAFLEGQTTPLSVAMLAEGWAVAAPYPVEHRHRASQLQAQEQAMAAQANLWQAGLRGPVAPWRPSGSAESAYIAADPALHAALDLLYTVPTGQELLNRLTRMAPTILLRELGPGAGGFADPFGYYIVMSSGVGVADPRSMAAGIAHEATHAIDFATAAMDLTSFSCFEMEQRSHGFQAKVWSEYFGPSGKPDPQDSWDRATNDILRFAQRGDIENYVRRSAGYEIQCARERTPG